MRVSIRVTRGALDATRPAPAAPTWAELDWHDLRAYAAARDVPTYHRTRAQIEQALDARAA